jgi:hypothetical protein
MKEPQRFTIWSVGGLPVVFTPEEIDLVNADQLLHALLLATADATVVVVDMTATTFCDASTIDTLEWVNRQLKGHDGELRVIPAALAPPAIRATRAEQPFPIYANLLEALTAKEEYPRSPAQVNLPEFMHSIANLPRAGQAAICAWCHVTPWAPWRQREREYERALSCHQAHEITAPERCSADNVVDPFGYGTSCNQPASQDLDRAAA